MKRILKFLNYIEKIEIGICILFLFGMTLIVILQVCSRYLFNYSFVWAEELVRYLMIWMVMIGAALVQSINDHIRIDYFPMVAGPRGRRAMETIFRLCTLVFIIILTVKGIKIVYFNRLFESSGLRISMLWPNLALPLGGILIGAYTGMPIAFMMGFSASLYLLFSPQATFLDMAPQKLFAGIDSFVLMCIPFFLLAGEFLTGGKIAGRVVEFWIVVVGGGG